MKLLHSLALVVVVLVSACTPEVTAARSAPAHPESQAVRYRLVAELIDIDESISSQTQTQEPPPLRLLAANSLRARIVDKAGNEIRRAPLGQSISEMRTSPDRQWVLLYFGGAKYAVASIDGLKDIAIPPERPDAPADATGFSWLILDDGRLIGQADLPSLEPTEALTASEADGLPPRGTLVYIYTIATGIMTPVEIDDSVPQPFGLTIDSSGNAVISSYSGLGYLGMKVIETPAR